MIHGLTLSDRCAGAQRSGNYQNRYLRHSLILNQQFFLVERNMKFLVLLILLSSPTIPPGPWDEEESEGETKIAELDMPVCYPCDGPTV